MEIVLDEDFGELRFDGVWTGSCEVVIFQERSEVELVVQTFDNNPISETQRLAYREFLLDSAFICSSVEEAVFTYYNDRLSEFREWLDACELNEKAPQVSSVGDVGKLVTLIGIKVMYPLDPGMRQIGFIFDAVFDSQLGVGVLVTNGSVEAVEVQDFLLS
ncbi:DUF6985 domain-containing protein [Metapseudomonas otitidis]